MGDASWAIPSRQDDSVDRPRTRYHRPLRICIRRSRRYPHLEWILSLDRPTGGGGPDRHRIVSYDTKRPTRPVRPGGPGRVHDRSALALAAAVTSAYQISSNFRR